MTKYIKTFSELYESVVVQQSKQEYEYISEELEEETHKKLKGCLYSIMFSHGFYAKALSYVGVYLTAKMKKDGTGTAFTDYNNIYFDPGFIKSQKVEAIKFVIIHEVLHIVFSHNSRKGNKDHLIWNYATDYAINDIIVLDKLYESGSLKMPQTVDGKTFGLHDEKWRGMKAEDIYEELIDSPPPPSPPGPTGPTGPTGPGGTPGSGSGGSDGVPVDDISDDPGEVEVITIKEAPGDTQHSGGGSESEDRKPGGGGSEEGGDDESSHNDVGVGDFVTSSVDGNIYRVTDKDNDGNIDTRPATPLEIEQISKGNNIGL